MLDLRQTRRDERDIRVRAFRRRGANRLVRTSLARVALAGLLRFRTRAVFCKSPWNISQFVCVLGCVELACKNVPGSGATRLVEGLVEGTAYSAGSASAGAMLS